MPPPGLAHGGGDVGADEVDPGDVETHDAGRGLRDLHVVRMSLHRAVDRGPAGGHVAGEGQLHEGAGGRHAVGREALIGEDGLGALVQPDLREHLLVADAAPGIGVGDLDQLPDRGRSVAGHACRYPLGDGRQVAADDQAAVVVARDVRLDDDVPGPALAEGDGERRADVRLVADVEHDAPAVVAVERLEDARVAETTRGAHRLVLGLDHLGPRHGQTRGVEQPVGQLLVGRDVDRDAAGPRRHGRPDPLLVDALAQLDQAVAIEAHERDVAAGRLIEQRLRGGSEGEPLCEPDELLQLGHQVERERRVVGRNEMVDERDGQLPRLETEMLLPVLEDDVVAAVLARAARLAVADVGAGEVLELQGNVLGHVPGPGAVPQPGDEPAAAAQRAGVILERGQQLDQRLDEARDRVARELLEHAEVHDLADHRLPGPVVRAAQDARLDDPKRGLGAGTAGAVGRPPA